MDRKFFLGLVLVGIFIGNQIVEEMGIYCDFINSYLDDFLAFPIILWLGQYINRTFFGLDFVLSVTAVFIVTNIFGLLFEFLYPLLSENFARDPWDLVVYNLGALFYVLAIAPDGPLES
ncbi:MAG: hypothetical protein KDI06_19310 [Calditrichaeota bacterium]|nr:hypothetical protein [Calditrichota bacterium]